MDLLLQIKLENYPKVKDILLKDDVVSRASIKFKDAKEFEKEGYYCYISGLEEQCKRALELIKDSKGNKLAEEVKGKNKEKVVNKFKEEEDRAMEGFGNIFG